MTPEDWKRLRRLIRDAQKQSEQRIEQKIDDAMKGAVHFLFTQLTRPAERRLDS